MKKNIYFIDTYPINASKILETLKAYFKDEKNEVDVKMIVADTNNSISKDTVEYYQKFCNDFDISFDYIKDFESLENTIDHIDRTDSLVLINPLMDETVFYFCKNRLDSMNIKFVLIGTRPWYEEKTEYNSKIEQFKEVYKQTTGEDSSEILAGQSLMKNCFVEKEAQKLLVLSQ